MTPTNTHTLADGLCSFDDFLPFMPAPISRARVCYLSDNGRFPKYTRISGGYSTPLFQVAQVKKWYRDMYSELMPDAVARFEQNFMQPNKVAVRKTRTATSAAR